MSRRSLYRCVILSTKAGDPQRLEYYLLTDDAHFDGGYLEVYGVEILLYRPGVRKPEIARVRGVTSMGGRILHVLQQLSDNAVTPVCLKEVMDSILAGT